MTWSAILIYKIYLIWLPRYSYVYIYITVYVYVYIIHNVITQVPNDRSAPIHLYIDRSPRKNIDLRQPFRRPADRFTAPFAM